MFDEAGRLPTCNRNLEQSSLPDYPSLVAALNTYATYYRKRTEKPKQNCWKRER